MCYCRMELRLPSRPQASYRSERMKLLARSMASDESDAREICVVSSESWPRASEIVAVGIPFDFAIEAHEWRVT